MLLVGRTGTVVVVLMGVVIAASNGAGRQVTADELLAFNELLTGPLISGTESPCLFPVNLQSLHFSRALI